MDEQLLAKRYGDNEKYTRAVENGMRLGGAIKRLRTMLLQWRSLARFRARHA